MNVTTVNQDTCTRCGACVHECPTGVLEMNPSTSYPCVSEVKTKNCIACGHCEAVCPEQAFHFGYPQGAESPLQTGESTLTAKDLGLYLRKRRSIRNYVQKPIEQERIEELMDVVRYAPTGVNYQPVHWTIVQTPEKIKELAEITIEFMRQAIKANAPMKDYFQRLVTAYEAGFDVICRNAPSVFIAHCSDAIPSGRWDSFVAASHLEIVLPSFELGGCWAGYLMVAFMHSEAIKKAIQLPENHSVHAILLAGYPEYSYFGVPKRNKAKITWL